MTHDQLQIENNSTFNALILLTKFIHALTIIGRLKVMRSALFFEKSPYLLEDFTETLFYIDNIQIISLKEGQFCSFFACQNYHMENKKICTACIAESFRLIFI